jgi:U32 family peptidase
MTSTIRSEQVHRKPELLAPAGSLEAFFAAMEKGADAVYAGLKDFSARAKAKNFTLEQLERMLGYAHPLGRRIYVTLNTLVKEQELPPLVNVLADLEAMGVDGVIVQDLAVARLVRNHFPGIPLHASTQMTIHNSLGVLQLEELGFERAVLARELHLDEIRAIVGKSRIGIECFIHGALCFSISGQCYFSSFLGGHSGNRGRCAQPCRRQYTYRGKEGYYFSTNDFSSIDMLPELCDAGVASLKIEGRMKSAEYVASVVGAYRLALDAPEKQRGEAVAQAKELLKLSFGRVPTKGFLASTAPTDIATPSLKGATGRFLGAITAIRGDRIVFETRDRLHLGDRIRIQPKSDMAGRAFTIKEMFAGKEQVKLVKERSVVAIPSPFAFKLGDTVFKVSSETAFTMSENACLRRLESTKGGKIPCSLTVSWHDGMMRIAAKVKGSEFISEFPLGGLEEARTSDMEGVLRGQFTRTGDTRFELSDFAAPGFPALLIPGARLKDIRRDYYRALAEYLNGALGRNRAAARNRALAALVGSGGDGRPPRSELIVRLEQLRDYHLLHQEGIDAVSFPVSRAALHQLPELKRKLRGRESRIIWRLPFIMFEADLHFYREAVTYLAEQGFHRFEAANLSHFPLLKGLDPEISTDYRLFSLNSQALLAWQELGATGCTLYIEDDADNMAQLLTADVSVPRRVLVYGSVPVLTTKIRIRDVKGDAPLVSDRGDSYRTMVKEGLTVVTPSKAFSLTGQRRRLQEMGCSSFIVDLSQLPAGEWPKVLDAFNRGTPLPDTTEFNFQTGLV